METRKHNILYTNFLLGHMICHMISKKDKQNVQLQNENHTEDRALGSHPRDNGHVTH